MNPKETIHGGKSIWAQRYRFFEEYFLSGSPLQRFFFRRVFLRKILPLRVFQWYTIKFVPDYQDITLPRYQAYVEMKKNIREEHVLIRPPNVSRLGIVSVVLPVYNHGKYLRESIESVLSQTYSKIELIIVNDGSTDSTITVLQNYRAHPKIKILDQPNKKLPAALNNGFRLAQGEYLTWTSADNRMFPRQVEFQVDFLRRHPDISMVFANYQIIDDAGRLLHGSKFNEWLQVPYGSPNIYLPKNVGELNFVPLNFIGPCILYRASAAAAVGVYDESLVGVEDYDYWMRMNRLFRIAHIDLSDPLYQYRIHEDSMTGGEKNSYIFEKMQKLVIIDSQRRKLYGAQIT
jgi:glycosyltransferase involved in cell wall biosynthesis